MRAQEFRVKEELNAAVHAGTMIQYVLYFQARDDSGIVDKKNALLSAFHSELVDGIRMVYSTSTRHSPALGRQKMKTAVRIQHVLIFLKSNFSKHNSNLL
uniref:Uncharacterized protein n=1 Tax=Leersia perrieri TaxID=77586 RepID=A0A0D9UXZ7_9ORYZ